MGDYDVSLKERLLLRRQLGTSELLISNSGCTRQWESEDACYVQLFQRTVRCKMGCWPSTYGQGVRLSASFYRTKFIQEKVSTQKRMPLAASLWWFDSEQTRPNSGHTSWIAVPVTSWSPLEGFLRLGMNLEWCIQRRWLAREKRD